MDVAPTSAHTLRTPLAERLTALATLVVPPVGVAVAVALCWGRGVSTLDLILLAAMYAITVVGVTVGFHRHFAHPGFRCGRVVCKFLAVAGSMAAEGPLVFWVAVHRQHHADSDGPDDPHTPHGGARGVLRGFWHAHVGWMFAHPPVNFRRFVPDLLRDRMAMTVSKWYFAWVALGVLLPGIVGGLLTWSVAGALTGALWGGLVRLFLVHHITWCVNSLGHCHGTRPFDTGDHSCNSFALALLTFGEGWHNNHHAFPTSARHGLRWWQIDVSYLVIWSLRHTGLAWDVQTAAASFQERKRTRPAPALDAAQSAVA